MKNANFKIDVEGVKEATKAAQDLARALENLPDDVKCELRKL